MINNKNDLNKLEQDCLRQEIILMPLQCVIANPEKDHVPDTTIFNYNRHRFMTGIVSYN